MTRLVGAGDLRKVEGAVTYFVTVFDNKLKQEYPCTKVLSEKDVATLLDHERQRALLGTETSGMIESIGDAMGCEYLVSLEIGTLPGSKFVCNASLIPYRTKIPMVHASGYSAMSATSGDANLKSVEEVAEKLVDALKHIEICPFEGEIKVKVVSDLKSDTTITRSAYCNMADGTYKEHNTIDNHTENNWELQKISTYRADGNATFSINEKITTDIEDPCHICPSGRQYLWEYHSVVEKKGEVKGLSSESMEQGQKIHDARAEIKFNEDDTYFIIVKATSEKGNITEVTRIQAEGACDSDNPPPKTVNNKADVPLRHTFGPYPGTSKNKVLSEKSDPIVEIDPVSREKTTYTLEFNLSRD